MTSPINPISAANVRPVTAERAGSNQAGADKAETAGDFAGAVGNALREGLDKVAGLENAVNEASQKAATGDLQSVTDYMIATTEAQLATEITVAVRDRAVTAFNDIMRMQI